MNKNKIILFDHSLLSKENSEVLILDGDKFLQIKQTLVSLILKERYNFLNNIIFFKNLDGILKYNIAEKLELINFKKDDYIIKKGDKESKSIYFIKKGFVKCCLNGKNVKNLGENKYFGIIALILNTERTLDVIAGDNCQCFELKEKNLIDLLGDNYIENILFLIFKDIITNNNYLYDIINEDNINLLFKKFSLNQYKKNEKIHEKILEKKLSKKRIIIILAGNFVEEKTMKIIYSQGSLIGEEIIKNQKEIRKDLIAFPDIISLEADFSEIENILGEEYKSKQMNIQILIHKLNKFSIFKNVEENTIKLIINNIKKDTFPKGKIIINENSKNDNLYIITKGTAIVIKDNKLIRHYERGDFFGEINLLNNTNSTHTIKALSNLTTLTIKKEDFNLISQNEIIKHNLTKKIHLEDENIQYEDLKFIKHIGQGQFGSVSLVHNNKYIYAIKAISKKDANLKRRLADYIIGEKNILLSISHPFIGKLIKTFKNKTNVFLLLEFINGESLSNLLKAKKKTFTINETLFYTSSLFLILDYLQKEKIIHRDIKPQNIIINSKGYIKLIDFGTSKIINDFTSTIIGTPHYMAPEILKGKGYSFSCDFWSIGIITFEIFYECVPFGNNARDVMEIYNDIMYNNKFNYPFYNESYDLFNELIEGLLNKKVEKRFCNLASIKKLDIYEDFNWKDLINCCLKSPLIPQVLDLGKINFKMFNMKYDDYVGGDSCEYIYGNSYENSSWDEDF